MTRTENDFSVQLGALLRQARIVANKTQKQVADQVKCQPTDVSRIEAGKQVPTIKRFVELCNASEVPPADVLMALALERVGESEAVSA